MEGTVTLRAPPSWYHCLLPFQTCPHPLHLPSMARPPQCIKHQLHWGHLDQKNFPEVISTEAILALNWRINDTGSQTGRQINGINSASRNWSKDIWKTTDDKGCISNQWAKCLIKLRQPGSSLEKIKVGPIPQNRPQVYQWFKCMKRNNKREENRWEFKKNSKRSFQSWCIKWTKARSFFISFWEHLSKDDNKVRKSICNMYHRQKVNFLIYKRFPYGKCRI